MVSFEQVKNDPAIRVYIRSADNTLKALGYTEHSFSVTRGAFVKESVSYKKAENDP